MRIMTVTLAALTVVYFATAALLYDWRIEMRTPVHVDQLPKVATTDKLTLILLGDMGLPGNQREAVLQQIRDEKKDYIVALGDLIYPHPPACPTGTVSERDMPFYQDRVAAGLQGLGAPVFAILGNHAYYRGKRNIFHYLFPWVPTPRELGEDGQGAVTDPAACMVDFLGQLPNIHLPGLDYSLDFGVAQIVFVDTNHLGPKEATLTREAFARGDGWKVLFGHHVLKTYHDKEHEDYVSPWLAEYAISPELYAHGHAHVLQLGVYNGITAVTSGTGAKLRDRPACPPDCGEGQHWGASQAGYAVLELTQTQLQIQFKDSTGQLLYTWDQLRTADVPERKKPLAEDSTSGSLH